MNIFKFIKMIIILKCYCLEGEPMYVCDIVCDAHLSLRDFKIIIRSKIKKQNKKKKQA